MYLVWFLGKPYPVMDIKNLERTFGSSIAHALIANGFLALPPSCPRAGRAMGKLWALARINGTS